jgi:hypothetical protein
MEEQQPIAALTFATNVANELSHQEQVVAVDRVVVQAVVFFFRPTELAPLLEHSAQLVETVVLVALEVLELLVARMTISSAEAIAGRQMQARPEQ